MQILPLGFFPPFQLFTLLKLIGGRRLLLGVSAGTGTGATLLVVSNTILWPNVVTRIQARLSIQGASIRCSFAFNIIKLLLFQHYLLSLCSCCHISLLRWGILTTLLMIPEMMWIIPMMTSRVTSTCLMRKGPLMFPILGMVLMLMFVGAEMSQTTSLRTMDTTLIYPNSNLM
jgi:hypothetical protein